MRGLSACALFAVLATTASATVTQVDGTILPESNPLSSGCDGAGDDSLQACFNQYEGVSPPDPNAINEISDASELPQTFLPNLSQPVVFRDIAEGAGFENSFGWYNVGDDVVTPAGRAANLHPVFGCGVPMATTGNATTHAGNPAFYVQNANPVVQVSVDFQAELNAGRYKGGQIGFYLITPEGNPSADNCGDFKNGSDGQSLFGFIYFTQKDLNDDGDFVHHLVYRSRLVADRFYFGFEDLFRGGDNDFEDMMLIVTGLTPPCVPQPEVCDGLDNDCDSIVDGADPDLTGVGNACTCDGQGMACDNGPLYGQCQAGVTRCSPPGVITCHGTGVPSAETCDGSDQNCNNVVDDNPSGTGATCDGPDADLCPEGTIVCQNGGLACSDTSGPNQELCNNADDDCDGMTDEGDPEGGGTCGSAIGVCMQGTFTCQGGMLVCVGATSGGPETCNGLDDDCNGVVDNSPTDVGQPCGATDVGQCSFGMTICVGGSLQCAGEVGPTPEKCNLLDDNCNNIADDNPVDAGQPCGSSIGACMPGTYECMMGMLVCTGGVGPMPETCNGIDDDCNGIVDDNVPGENQACGIGQCLDGMTKCIAGSLQCVGGATSGTEVCNGMDDDCDNLIDEGPLCGGGVCDNGTCAAPCVASEFPCPPGKKCNENNYCVDDPCYGVTCPNDLAGNIQTCIDGVCQPVCDTQMCPTGLVCRGSDGACVPDRCEYLPKCMENELCIDGACVADPCVGVTCPSDQFCRAGVCVAACGSMQCPPGQECRDGVCAETGCSITCADGMICNPETSSCIEPMCDGVQCPTAQVCDPLTGDCIPDPCQGVTCPSGQMCSLGQCRSARGSHVTVGGGGCDASGGDPSLLLGLVALALLVRRRRLVLPAAIAAAVSLGAGCKVNDFCLDCEVAGDGGMNTGDGGGSGSGSGDGGVTCDPMQVHPEMCNHADDDCDGTIDETFDLQTDLMNCGACGTKCNKAGAQTTCQAGACSIIACFPGFFDRNGDITGPYATSDGCEYMCFPTNNGVEACDEVDNDCDGNVDETFDLTSDIANCGQCNKVCQFFQATPHCSNSTCSFDPTLDCAAGYLDIDGNQVNGCEYQCTPTGAETCDLQDNNCNGMVDETFDLTSDVNNCGGCGFTCQFPHATPHCTLMTCMFDPQVDCQAGYVDVDGNQLNGCEYQCSPTNGGVEVCDAVDNDCDGVADDAPADAGGTCSATTPPMGQCLANGTLTCSNGQLVCVNATQPVAETCNNRDDDCDSAIDNGVTQSCYTGPMGTSGVGLCKPGSATCSAGMFGSCVGEVVPTGELCNNLDDNCNGMIDDGPGGTQITASCYTGPAGTANVGTCVPGTATCTFGAFGGCIGQITPTTDICGDNLDTDCDSLSDAQEGCLALDPELRLDGGGTAGSLGTTAGARHDYDLVFARGGSPLGTHVYAAWSHLEGSVTEVYFRRSLDGGITWEPIINVTSGVSATAVKPVIAVSPGATDRVVLAYQTVTGGVRDIVISVSADSGATFGTASGALDASGDSFHHAVAVRGTTIVVAWEKLDTTTLDRDIESRASTDGGATWGTERRINVGSGATRFAGRPQVAVTSSGAAIWAWREKRGGATRDIFAARSANPNDAPASDVRIDGDTGQTRDADFPQLVVEDNSAYLVWQDVSTQTGGGSDVMFARSVNGGASWSAERIIDDPTSEVSASFTPVLAVDPKAAGGGDDLIAIAWEDRRAGTQVYTSTSLDGGASFAAAVRASNDTGDPITGTTSAPQIASAGGGVLVVVYQNKLGQTPSHVYTSASIDSGATWMHTHSRLDSGSGAAIAPQVVGSLIAGQPAAVAGWADFRSNGVNGDTYVATAR